MHTRLTLLSRRFHAAVLVGLGLVVGFGAACREAETEELSPRRFHGAVGEAKDPFVALSIEKARTEAQDRQRVVMLYFRTAWSDVCKEMDIETWTDVNVREWLAQRVIALRFDAEKEKGLTGAYRVNSFPTFIFLKPDGGEMDRIAGRFEIGDFLNEANALLAGKSRSQRARERIPRSGYPADERLRHADLLRHEAKYADALVEYVAVIDDVRHGSDPFAGLPELGLFRRIVSLGAEHPPAREWLRQRYDQVSSRIQRAATSDTPRFKSSDEIRENAMDALEAVAIAEVWRGREDLFLLCEQATARQTRRTPASELLVRHTFDWLLYERRYAVIATELGDEAADFNEAVRAYREQRSRRKDTLASADRDAAWTRTFEYYLDAYEALLGAGDRRRSERLADAMTAACPFASTVEWLITRAHRVGNRKEVARLGISCLFRLSAEDAAIVQARAKEVLEEMNKPTSGPASAPSARHE